MDHKESKIIKGYNHILYQGESFNEKEMIKRSKDYYQLMDKRRSIREFSDRFVPKVVIDHIILSASTAPSGAHKQPWTFCAVSNQKIKSEIRKAAEIEEKESYTIRMSERWKNDLEPIGTDMYKPFLEIAPWLIIVFRKAFNMDQQGLRHKNYYVNESAGIASGMLISAIHHAGLVTLTHTPSPMNFLAKILNRPSNERAFLLLPVGYPKDPVYVPDLKRKKLDEISDYYE